MKTSAQKLAMVFVFFAQMVFAQDAHQQFETTFSNFTINKVVETLKIKKRYAEESAVQTLVDLNYTNFQLQLEEDLNLGLNISVSEIESRKHKFLFELALEVDNLLGNDPKGELPDKIFNGPCVNMDFEDGNLNGWDLFIGETDGSVMYSYVNSVPALPGPNHLIVGGGVDPVVGIPRVNPDGGSFSVRLGNGTVTGAGAARMSQSFLVDATNIFYTYSYAVVFQNPNGHTAEERPYFTVRVFDELGANIACGEYSVYADPANASDYLAVGDVLYKDWTTVFTNLSAYIGQNVTIEFTTGDCSRGGHYAYAYLDASCSVQEITATDYDICPGQNSTLTAPAGVGSYLWNTGEITQSITINAGGIYTCLLTPPQGAGCSILLDVEIIEFPNPVASFSVDNAIGCLGTPINFTDNSTITAPSTIATYQWNFGNGIITPASSGAVIAVPNTIGTYTALSHDYAANGAFVPQLTVVSSDGCSDVFNLPISINALPVVVAGVDQTICSGDQVTLNGAGALTYSWNNGVTNGIAFTPVVGTVIYTVTGTNINGCENSDQVQVVVNPLPIVGAGVNQVVCSGDQVTIAGSGASTYTWDNGITNGVAFFPAVGTVVYTVTGTDLNGCENTDQVQVIVNPLPLVVAGIDQTVCSGDQVTLNGAGASTYSWDNGIINGVAFIPAVGSVVYTVTGTDLNGCENTDQVQVTVNALPIVGAGLDQTVCSGDQVNLNGSGATVYTWDNGVIDGVAFTPAVGTIIYTVTGTDLNGCENTDQVQVVVNALPIVGAGVNQSVCIGDQVTLIGTGASTYTWDNGVNNNVAFVPAVGTVIYTVVGTDVNGCENTDQVEVIVNALPIVDAGLDKIVCQGTQVTLSGSGANTYSWNPFANDGVAFVQAVGTVIYTVTGTDLNGCVNTDQVQVTVNPLPIVTAGPDQVVCAGTSVTLAAVGAITYTWNNGVINGIAFNPVSGTLVYTVIGTNAFSCENFDQVQVIVNPNPNTVASPDQTICNGTSITLVGAGATNYAWDNGVINGVPFTPVLGTTVYTVIGSFITGCHSLDSVTITVNPKPIVTTFNAEICKGESVVLKGFGADTYAWTGGVIDNVAFYPMATENYFVTGTNLFNCSSSAMAKVVVHDLPIASFYMTNEHFTTTSSSSMFMNTSFDAVSYSWNFNDGSPISAEESPYHEFIADAEMEFTVQLVATTSFGCVDTAIRVIEIKEELLFYVPNTFTPDGDNLNNTFQPVFVNGFDPQGYTLYIFNRWGQIVFESHDTNFGWNGRYGVDGDFAQDGTYSWKIEVKDEHSANREMFIGHVNILR